MSEENIFFVVGASKSGTSSVNKYLDQHPSINMVKDKDVACYFCNDYGLPITFSEYKTMLIPNDSYQAYGDSCHAYLTDERSANWIKAEFPNAKIIIILRNPADRAFSQYYWLASQGYEFAASFEDALDMENDRFLRNVRKQKNLIQNYKDNYLYFQSGLYSQQIKRYLDNFPTENILFIKFDDLTDDIFSVVNRLYSFVGVEPFKCNSLPIYNDRAEPYNIKRQYFIRRYLQKFLPTGLVNQLLKLNLRKTPKTKFNPKTRCQLQLRFEQDIRITQNLSGLDLSNWLIK